MLAYNNEAFRVTPYACTGQYKCFVSGRSALLGEKVGFFPDDTPK